ncbi:MAG TPA: DNA-binding transcriptional regulator [Kiritimatiellia bacterium]|nr:DNA-binding transcriptional regulator [Kiritimatiellia bacterium]
MRGVLNYAREQGEWSLSTFPPVPQNLTELLRMNYAGCLGLLGQRDIAEIVKKSGVPAINISGGTFDFGMPRVGVSDHEIGIMAADYFLRQGFVGYAFYGLPGEDFSDSRLNGYQSRLAEQGHEVTVYHPRGKYPDRPRLRNLSREMAAYAPVRWLAGLPAQTAILACDDLRANFLSNCAAHLELRMPEDLGLLGVGNDDVYCETASVPLSSISTPAEEVGYEAAQCLHAILRKQPVPRLSFPRFRSPTGVVERQSTDLLKITHPNLARALAFMREHGRSKTSAHEIARAAGMSLRSLERVFQSHFHRTIQQELIRLRLEWAKAELRNSDKGLDVIGSECGLNSGVYLSQLFRKVEKTSPGQYRQQFRKGSRPR